MADAPQEFDFDVVVVGAGPAGLAAAVVSAECGRRVALIEGSPWLGGQIWRGEETRPVHSAARHWLGRLERSGAQVFRSTTVFAAPAPRVLLAERGADGHVRGANPGGAALPRGLEPASGTARTTALAFTWRALILATGARELFLPFPGWTLPNVVGAGGLSALVKGGLPVRGNRVVVAGSGPLLIAVAAEMRRHGAKVACIAEQASLGALLRFGIALPWLAPAKLAQGIGYQRRLLGVPYRSRCWPLQAIGQDRVEAVELTDGHRTWTEPCDYLACGFGLVPSLELPRLLGCQVGGFRRASVVPSQQEAGGARLLSSRDTTGGMTARREPRPTTPGVAPGGVVRVNELQETSMPNVFCAGEPTGVGGAERAVIEGQIAGLAAAGREAEAMRWLPAHARQRRFAEALDRAFALRPELRRLALPDTLVCRCEDVPREALDGCGGWHEAKLHTRCGMGACQGRICGGATRFLYGWDNDSTRPPILPVSLGALGAAKPLLHGAGPSSIVR